MSEVVFKVSHGLGVDFLVETDDFLKLGPDIFRSFSGHFRKRVWSRSGSPWELLEQFRHDSASKFHEDADCEVKSAVDTTFDVFYNICGAQHVGQNAALFFFWCAESK